MNYRQIYARKAECEKRIKEVCPNATHDSGIYCFTRVDEDGFKFAYIGQSVNILQRLADHLQGYQYIDLSIKKHGLWSEENPTGYKVYFLEFPEDELYEKEQYYIKKYANAGYQLKNIESGGLLGKTDIGERKPPKTYTEGVVQGEKNMAKRIKHLFDLHLDYVPKKNPPTKLQEKAMQKFKDFLEVENESKID